MCNASTCRRPNVGSPSASGAGASLWREPRRAPAVRVTGVETPETRHRQSPADPNHASTLAERIRQRTALEAKKHADLDEAAEQTLAALDLLIAQLDSSMPKLRECADHIGGPDPQTDGTLAPRTVLN